MKHQWDRSRTLSLPPAGSHHKPKFALTADCLSTRRWSFGHTLMGAIGAAVAGRPVESAWLLRWKKTITHLRFLTTHCFLEDQVVNWLNQSKQTRKSWIHVGTSRSKTEGSEEGGAGFGPSSSRCTRRVLCVLCVCSSSLHFFLKKIHTHTHTHVCCVSKGSS